MRLIDADAAGAKLRRMADIEVDMGYKEVAGATLGIAVGMQSDVLYPTIDPVKHGHWITDEYNSNYHVCSECDHIERFAPAVIRHVHYCWFCGAKMDQEDDDE